MRIQADYEREKVTLSLEEGEVLELDVPHGDSIFVQVIRGVLTFNCPAAFYAAAGGEILETHPPAEGGEVE